MSKLFKNLLETLRWYKCFGLEATIQLLSLTSSKLNTTKKIRIDFGKGKLEIILRTETTDYSVFKQIFINHDYDILIPFEPEWILDAGANNGVSSLFFSRKYPASKILAIEPDAGNFETLTANTKAEKNILPMNCAIWGTTCFLNINSTDEVNKDAITVQRNKDENKNSIRAYSINDLLKINGIKNFDIVKIDVEGSEVEIFSANTEWLSKVRIIIIELHDWIKKGCTVAVFKALVPWGLFIQLRGENIICFRDYEDYMKSLGKW
jgi:FkbM family methyltransferase